MFGSDYLVRSIPTVMSTVACPAEDRKYLRYSYKYEGERGRHIFLLFFFFPSHLRDFISAPLLQLPPFRTSDQPSAHIAGTPPPFPLTVCAFQVFIARRVAAVSSLVDSRRIVRRHAILAGAFCEPSFAQEKKAYPVALSNSINRPQ